MYFFYQTEKFSDYTCQFRGQQISWMAAKSITHKFKRLYDPTLPEKPGQVAYVISKNFLNTSGPYQQHLKGRIRSQLLLKWWQQRHLF